MLNLSHHDIFLGINTNILETNIINIFFLFLLLFYAYNTSFQSTIKQRQREIIENIENSQKDFLKSLEIYKLSELKNKKLIFYLEFKRKQYIEEKKKIIKIKTNYLLDTFFTTLSTSESIVINFQIKSLLILQNYILILLATKILRKFYFLSEKDQLKIIDLNINKLNYFKNEY